MCRRGQESPPSTQSGILLSGSTSLGLRSPPGPPPARLFTNCCQALSPQRCPCQRRAWLTDRLQQMVSEAPGGILKAGFADLFDTGE